MSENALANRRRRRRHQLSADICVIDHLRHHPMGQLVNIHQEGLLLMGHFLNIHSSHQISLILPNSVNQQTQFELGIECLWSQQADSDEHVYWSGCSIIDLSPMAEACIQKMIHLRS
ncbi:MAG: PilZ domain-containing protein [Cellvibrionaceae bacterium]